MSHTPHELAEEFPADIEKMQALKLKDAHFAKLFEDYSEVNLTIHKSELKIEPMADEHEEALRKKRMVLKDEIAQMLRETA